MSDQVPKIYCFVNGYIARGGYPDGYELEWVDDVPGHEGVAEATRLNHALAAAADELTEVAP